MKWRNPGNEFDGLKKAWSKKNGELLLFWAGGENESYEIIKRIVALEGSSDKITIVNNSLAGEEILGKRIISEDEAIIQMLENDKICILSDNTIEFERRLAFSGFGRNLDYFSTGDFLKKYLDKFAILVLDKVYIEHLGHVTNYKCTLRCKKCSAAIPYINVKNPTYEQMIQEIELLFSKVDYVYQYDLTGAETFVVSNLIAEIIDYLFTNYNDRFHHILITTNATIVPSEDALQTISTHKDRVIINVSVYDCIEGWTEKCKRFLQELDKYKIDVNPIIAGAWIDFGFDQSKRNLSEEKITQMFDMCEDFCRMYERGRFIYCNHGYLNNIAFWENELDEDENLDISNPDVNGVMVVEFMSGFQKKGYINICAHCNGWGQANKNYIPVAEQLNNR